MHLLKALQNKAIKPPQTFKMPLLERLTLLLSLRAFQTLLLLYSVLLSMIRQPTELTSSMMQLEQLLHILMQAHSLLMDSWIRWQFRPLREANILFSLGIRTVGNRPQPTFLCQIFSLQMIITQPHRHRTMLLAIPMTKQPLTKRFKTVERLTQLSITPKLRLILL